MTKLLQTGSIPGWRVLLVMAVVLSAACRSGDPPRPAGREPAAAETYQNTVKWSTASEVDNFGFDVYRGLSAEGPFERLNEDPIEGGGTTDEPRYYRYVDDTIDPHETYYYYVESISMSGDRERFTPVGKAPPKVGPAGDGQSP